MDGMKLEPPVFICYFMKMDSEKQDMSLSKNAGSEELLKRERDRLLRISRIVEDRLTDAPDGFLKITTSKNNTQFIYCSGNNKNSYIKKDKVKLAYKLAQKSYDSKVKRLVDRRLKQLATIAEEYKDNEIEDIYRELHPIRKSIVEAVEIPWDQRIKRWKSVPYNGKDFADNIPVICTKKGERVRSKTEKILADYFYDNGIEYKYECPLKLRGIGTIYPDFTFLRKRDGKEVYWEHDGRMDDPGYAEKAIQKINSYMLNGIFPGDNLILSFESQKTVLSDKIIQALIVKYGLKSELPERNT